MDNWKHRSEGMRCRSCMWYILKKTCTPVGSEPNKIVENVDIGRCRRHAPTMNGYPVVFGTDWCGDHKLDESKF